MLLLGWERDEPLQTERGSAVASLAQSCRGLAHGKLAGPSSPALPSHLHSHKSKGLHPAPILGLCARRFWWKSKEEQNSFQWERSPAVNAHSCQNTTPCINSSLLDNLIKRQKGKEKKPLKTVSINFLSEQRNSHDTHLWLLGFPAVGQGQTSSRRKKGPKREHWSYLIMEWLRGWGGTHLYLSSLMDFLIASAQSMNRESLRYPKMGFPSLRLCYTSAGPSRSRWLIFVQKQVLLAKAVQSLVIKEGKKLFILH